MLPSRIAEEEVSQLAPPTERVRLRCRRRRIRWSGSPSPSGRTPVRLERQSCPARQSRGQRPRQQAAGGRSSPPRSPAPDAPRTRPRRSDGGGPPARFHARRRCTTHRRRRGWFRASDQLVDSGDQGEPARLGVPGRRQPDSRNDQKPKSLTTWPFGSCCLLDPMALTGFRYHSP